MTMTPELRAALDEALRDAFLAPQDDPPVPTVDRLLAQLEARGLEVRAIPGWSERIADANGDELDHGAPDDAPEGPDRCPVCGASGILVPGRGSNLDAFIPDER